MKIQNILSGKIVDVVARKIFKGEVTIENGKIVSICEANKVEDCFILPGLIDAHVHIESSMSIPSQFAKMAVRHGVVSVVSDPHEISNVLGVDGLDFMITDGKSVPFKFYFGAPSCVPATSFETSGAEFSSEVIGKLLARKDVFFLAEMMNYPGVVFNDLEVMKKLEFARLNNKPIDGHAPMLSGNDLDLYANAGISTDHEASTIAEATEKILLGMNILIREGSAAKNFEALSPLLLSFPNRIMFCTDDCHPDDLQKGYINKLILRCIEKKYDIFDILRCATFNPVKHYNLNVGLLQVGDPADMIIVDNLNDFKILKTFIDGQIVFQDEIVYFDTKYPLPINNFNCDFINRNQIEVIALRNIINVMVAFDRELITKLEVCEATIYNGLVVSDIERDILKIVVVNRYKTSPISVGFIKGFGIKKGAVASSIAHDSHNIIAIGTNDFEIIQVVNRLIELKGGVVVSDTTLQYELQLEIAGLMSVNDIEYLADRYKLLNDKVKQMGSLLSAPLMTMSFMSLLVIPEFKIGDKGLFDSSKFEFVSLFA